MNAPSYFPSAKSSVANAPTMMTGNTYTNVRPYRQQRSTHIAGAVAFADREPSSSGVMTLLFEDDSTLALFAILRCPTA